ncbi:MAG: hypothetical protein KDA61_18730 [Planctomycetales bacterium]|nr:hypothetical protein [Planctomycetales bacterium]
MSKVRSRWRRAAFAVLAVVGVLLGAVATGFLAAKYTPRRYQALAPPAGEDAIAASTAMVDRAASLVNDARRDGDWSAAFTQDEINAWLSVEAPEKHPELFLPGVRDARTSIDETGVWAACRYDEGPLGSAVYSVQLYPTVVEPNLLAVRIDGAWAGAAPLPLGPLREQVALQLDDLGLDVSWSRSDGSPLLLLRIPEDAFDDGRLRQLTTLACGEGAIELGGVTREAPESPSSGDQSPSATESSERQ